MPDNNSNRPTTVYLVDVDRSDSPAVTTGHIVVMKAADSESTRRVARMRAMIDAALLAPGVYYGPARIWLAVGDALPPGPADFTLDDPRPADDADTVVHETAAA